MSFVLREGDDFMTLQEALAFIEPSDGTDRDRSTLPLSEEIDELLGSMVEYSPKEMNSHAQNPTATTEETKKKKPRMRSAASSSTMLQRRRKAEVLLLREQVTELQTVLNRSGGDPNSVMLKLNSKTYADLKARGQNLSRWQRCAVEQYEQRIKAQKQNQQLKKIMSQQRKTVNCLRAILRRQSIVKDMHYLFAHESPERLHGPLADNDVYRCMAQLENTVDSLYQHPTPQFELGVAPSLSSPVQTSYREQRKGDVVEVIITTPMGCSMVDGSNVIMRYLENERPPGSKPSALLKMVPLTMHHLGETLHFEKLHYIRKFSEPEKVTLVYSDILLLRAKGLKFCSKGYTTITPLPADPRHSCVVHSVLTRSVDHEGGNETGVAKGVALEALSKAIRLFWQSEQARLADEAAHVTGGSNYLIL